MNKEFFIRNKRIIWSFLVVAVVFSLFFIKTKSAFKNESAQQAGLIYSGNETIKDLVNQDTDGDGVPDWEENLYGLDPKNPETVPGVPDKVTLAKLQSKYSNNTSPASAANSSENLTETDKFSRGLFTTIAALNQTGGVNQGTIDNLSSSLEAQVDNPSLSKIFAISDIKTVPDSQQAISSYITSINKVFISHTLLFNKLGVAASIANNMSSALQQYLENTNDATSLNNMDPMIKDISGIISDMSKIQVPEQFIQAHLSLMNGFETVMENLSNMKMVNTDPILAMGAVNKFTDNMTALQSALSNLIKSLK